MSKWCQYCVDRSTWCSTDYKCIRDGKEKSIPDGYEKWYCSNENSAYANCPIYNKCYIVTVTKDILGKDNCLLESFKGFRNSLIQKDRKYGCHLRMYDAIGPVIANRIVTDEDRTKKASSVYKRLEGILDSIDNGDLDLATKKYTLMVQRLVVTFGLQDLYRAKRDSLKENHTKKYVKTLD